MITGNIIYSTNKKTSYYYDGSLLLAEKINGQVQKEYINDGQGIVSMVNPIYTNGTVNHYQRLYYLYDSLGSVSAVTGDHGLPLQRYTYSPYGACLNVKGDPINPLQFVGEFGGYSDNDSGLIYFWHRWYDANQGRWISRDPINVIAGINLYKYSGNRPNYWTDEIGFCPGGPSWQGDLAPSIGPVSPSKTLTAPPIIPPAPSNLAFNVCNRPRCNNGMFWGCMGSLGEIAGAGESARFFHCIEGSVGAGAGVGAIVGPWWGAGVAVIGGVGCTLWLINECQESAGCK